MWIVKIKKKRNGERDERNTFLFLTVTLNLSQNHQTLSPVSISNTGGWNALSEISTLYSLESKKLMHELSKHTIQLSPFKNITNTIAQCILQFAYMTCSVHVKQC